MKITIDDNYNSPYHEYNYGSIWCCVCGKQLFETIRYAEGGIAKQTGILINPKEFCEDKEISYPLNTIEI